MLGTGRDIPPGIPSKRGIVSLIMESLVSVKQAWEKQRVVYDGAIGGREWSGDSFTDKVCNFNTNTSPV